MHKEYAAWQTHRLLAPFIIEPAEKTYAKQRLRALPHTDGHLGQGEPVVQPAARDLLDSVAGFVLGRRSVRKEVRPQGWLRRRSRGEKGPDACFGNASTHKSM